METEDKKNFIVVGVYELIGTAFIMYATMIDTAFFPLTGAATAIMMAIAWNISGGHFNPAISLGVYIAEKDWKENAKTFGVMVVSQFLGAFFGILLGYLALFDPQWAKDYGELFN